MQPIVIVVPHIAPKMLSELGDTRERTAVRALGFQRVEEGLHVRVLVGGAAARHALGNAAAGELIPHGGPEEFASAVAVKDKVIPRSTAPQGGGERPLSESRIACCTQPPGQPPSRILIEDDHQIPPAPRRGQIREVTHPDLVRAGRPGPSHPIRMLPEPPVHAGSPPIHSHGPAAPDAHVLRGDAQLEEVIQATPAEGLWILPAGRCDLQALHALSGQGVGDVVERLNSQFDFVVIDSGPVLTGPEAMIYGQHVDAAVISTRKDVSRLPKVDEASKRERFTSSSL